MVKYKIKCVKCSNEIEYGRKPKLIKDVEFVRYKEVIIRRTGAYLEKEKGFIFTDKEWKYTGKATHKEHLRKVKKKYFKCPICEYKELISSDTVESNERISRIVELSEYCDNRPPNLLAEPYSRDVVEEEYLSEEEYNEAKKRFEDEE